MTDVDIKNENATTEIKIEIVDHHPNADGSSENITDLQNYLQTFNKEILTVQAESGQADGQSQPNANETANTTYYVTETGEYFYQADTVNGQVMTVITDDKNPEVQTTRTVTIDNHEKSNSESNENSAASDGQSKVVSDLSQSSHILLGEDSYQTVTIVPTETNPGEVSYVLIVQQPEEGEKEKEDGEEGDDQDLTIYDFEDADDPEANATADSSEEDDKSKIMKIVARKSQSVSQAHMCNYCNYTSPKKYLLSRHMKSHSEERPHKCSVCDRGFKTIASLQNHVNTHTGTKPHHCKHCPSAFTTSGELVRHVRYKHTHEKPHKCSICDYASVELSKMRNHMRCHTGERPYQCQHCTYASPDSFKLKRHLRIHTGERPYECDICHSRFTQSNSLKAHKLIHSDENDKPVFKCDQCPATCSRKTDLRIHVQKLHTSDRLFNCRRCGKNFPDRYTYKMHNKTHEGEKCWKCDLCPYASVSHRHLESHMLIHTDQKPFRCSLCDQCFRQKQLLKRHQNLYHDPTYVPPAPKEKTHECPECKRSFRHKGNLIRHMCMHDPESEAVQTASALKMGRQKKIQVVNGEEIKIISTEEEIELKDEIIENDAKLLKSDLGSQLIEGADGQHYVVLEVIQLQGGDGEQAVAVVSEGDFQGGTLTLENADASQFITPDYVEKHDTKTVQKITKNVVVDSTSDVQNCFGFDDEEEEMES
ncbi:transcriptional repressor CTCFL-like [Planococcus citri]|uniref:transcriptional repressor CTCFL-like n=1 Tax=Planococcus citri TaxID=170843 RepID=UPI0031F92184